MIVAMPRVEAAAAPTTTQCSTSELFHIQVLDFCTAGGEGMGMEITEGPISCSRYTEMDVAPSMPSI